MLAIIRETGEVPTAEEVAARANVSRRSVFRFFDDRESLLRATMELMEEDVLERYPLPEPTAAPLGERIRRIVAHRAEMYEFVAPVRRVADRMKLTDRLLAAEARRIRSLERNHLEEYFAERIAAAGAKTVGTGTADTRGATRLEAGRGNSEDRPATAPAEIVLDTLQTILSWNVWTLLRDELGYSAERSKEVLVLGMQSVLEAAADPATELTANFDAVDPWC